MKKTFIYFCIIFFSVSKTHSQTQSDNEVIVKIEEDYTNPSRMMWVRGDDYSQRIIQNGIYIAKAEKFRPSLKFDFTINQLACKYSSDMEFTLVKLKGDSKSFISISLNPVSFSKLKFEYNELGDWNLFEGNDILVKSGKAKTISGSNLIKIRHRRDLFEFQINGVIVTDYKTADKSKVNWYDAEIFSQDKKLYFGLDKVVFTGYLDEMNDKLSEYELERYSSLKYAKVYGRTDVFIIKDNNQKRLIDERGRISKNAYDEIKTTYTGNWLIVSNSDKTQFGYINAKGEEVIPLKYKDVTDYICNKNHKDCYVIDSYKLIDNENNILYIDPKTNVIISETVAKSKIKPKADLTKIEKLFQPKEGMQLAKDNLTNKFGYLDLNDNIILPFIYDVASDFGNNRAPVTINNKKIYIDKNGVQKIDANTYAYNQVFYNGFAVVKNAEGKFGYIDTAGKKVIDFIFTSADGFGRNLAAVCQDGKCGFLGLDLKPAIPLMYKSVGYFTESGLAMVRNMQGKYGYINKKGEIVIPIIYDSASQNWNLINNIPTSKWPFHTFMVKLGDVTKYFDGNGKEVSSQSTVK